MWRGEGKEREGGGVQFYVCTDQLQHDEEGGMDAMDDDALGKEDDDVMVVKV